VALASTEYVLLRNFGPPTSLMQASMNAQCELVSPWGHGYLGTYLPRYLGT
jgi:hypothetical protein